MTKKLESGAAKPETEEQNDSQPSEAPRDQQTSTGQNPSEQATPAELEARLGARIADEVERRFQSAKDKR